ncbi:MAG: FtsX-like permease family protein [Caldilineaceae bacterium]
MASAAASNLGLDLQLPTPRLRLPPVEALASGNITEVQANEFLSSLLGEDAPQLPEGSLEQIQGLLPQPEADGTDSAGDETPAASIPLLESLNIPDATELASALNLNTLRSEIDRVLGQFGLQLRQGDVYLNRLGAQQLDAQVGDVLEIFLGPIPVPYRVKGIVDQAGPMGTLTPVVMMKLDEAQQLLSPVMPGRVNAILVSNIGDAVDGLQHTDAVSERLRVLSLDDDGLAQVVAVLQRPSVQRVIEAEAGSAEAMIPSGGEAFFLSLFGGIIEGSMPRGEQLVALPTDVQNADMDALRSTLGNMANRAWLQSLPYSDADSADLNAAIEAMTPMDVLDPLSKRTVVAASGIAGTTFSTVFSIFGIFSIMAGVLLIFMIFVMLAAERRSEMGMARAIGMQRSHLVQMFLTEGVLYDLVAALVGVLLGLGVSFLMIDFLSALFNDVSSQFSGQELFFQFQFNVTTPSIIIAYCLGVLFTFVVVTFSSLRVSRLNIVAAIRDIPDAENGARRPLWQRIARGVVGPLLLGGGAYVIWWGMDSQGLTAILTGVTLTLIGVAFVAEWLVGFTKLRSDTRRRGIFTLVGLGMIVIWAVPWAQISGDGDAFALFQGNPVWVPLNFALGGPMLILGGILVVMFNADAWVWAINRLLGGIGALTPVLRTAIAYPLSSRFRTGMAMTMFAMVITTVVIMSIVIQATQTLVDPDVERSAGFDIQVNTTLLSFFDPITDFNERLSRAADFPQDQVAAVGTYVEAFEALKEPADDMWTRLQVIGVDAGYIESASEVYPFKLRAPGFEDDAAVWQAMAERDDVVIFTADAIMRFPVEFDDSEFDDSEFDDSGQNDGIVIEMDDEAAGEEFGPRRRQDELSRHFVLTQIAEDATAMPENVTVSLRNDAGEVSEFQVIGILDTFEMLAGSGMIVSQAGYQRAVSPEYTPSQWYVKVAEGADVHEVAAALERSFLSSGLNASILAENFAQGQQITRGVLQLFQGFMALGLFVGIAALGVITSRTVVERRQQVGMLRAIGYQPGMVALSFVLEASFIALVGIAIGTATAGRDSGRNMLGQFFDLHQPRRAQHALVSKSAASCCWPTSSPC